MKISAGNLIETAAEATSGRGARRSCSTQPSNPIWPVWISTGLWVGETNSGTTGQGGKRRPESCFRCGVAWRRHFWPAANREQVVLTWPAGNSVIDPARYAVVSRIRKTDSLCDQNAVRLGAGKLDGDGGVCVCPRPCPQWPCTHLRVRARVCAPASHHDGMLGKVSSVQLNPLGY